MFFYYIVFLCVVLFLLWLFYFINKDKDNIYTQIKKAKVEEDLRNNYEGEKIQRRKEKKKKNSKLIEDEERIVKEEVEIQKIEEEIKKVEELTTIKETIPEEEEKEIDLNIDHLIQEFLEYIRSKKIIHLDELSYHMNTDKKEMIKKLRDGEDHEQFGFLDKSGKYIHLNHKELALFEKLLLSNKKKMRKSELLKEFALVTASASASGSKK
jgi:hypothetical protein